VDTDAAKPAAAAAAEPAAPAAARSESAPAAPKPAEPVAASKPKPAAPAAPAAPSIPGLRTEKREKMSKMRQKIAERLKSAQNTAASLTTFQECDMGKIMSIRNKYKDEFEKVHGVKLGFMSAFMAASNAALQEFPLVNA